MSGDGRRPRRDDEKRDREVILARRRLFVASALAGAVVTQCDKPPFACLEPSIGTASADAAPPMPCLSMPMPVNDAAPAPCLEVARPDVDAGAPGSDAAASPPEPQVCLRVAPTRDAAAPAPKPCLKGPLPVE